MKKYLASAFILTLVVCSSANAQVSGLTKTGLSAATFLSIEVGPRSKAMGGAFVGVADDVSAIYWNPAGLAKLSDNSLMFSHNEWIAGINYDFAGASFPVGGFGTIGAFIMSLTMPEMIVRTVEQPEGTGELFGARNLALGLTYARNLTERFASGANFKFIRESIFNSSAKTVAVDFGTLFRTDFNDMVIGFSISNFGGDMKLSGIDTQVEVDISPNEFGNNDRIFANLQTEDLQLPLTFRVGVSMNVIEIEKIRVMVAVDAVVPNDNAQFVNVGGEYVIGNIFSLRAGYRTLFLEDSEEGLSVGAGLKYELFGETTLQFDYAYGDFGLLNNAQEFSLSIYF